MAEGDWRIGDEIEKGPLRRGYPSSSSHQLSFPHSAPVPHLRLSHPSPGQPPTTTPKSVQHPAHKAHANRVVAGCNRYRAQSPLTTARALARQQCVPQGNRDAFIASLQPAVWPPGVRPLRGSEHALRPFASTPAYWLAVALLTIQDHWDPTSAKSRAEQKKALVRGYLDLGWRGRIVSSGPAHSSPDKSK